MRRIDKMTVEQVADFFADKTECNVCHLFDKSKDKCTARSTACNKNLRDYLLQDVPMKKRFQTYESMKSAAADFNNFCLHHSCSNYQFSGGESCFACWLDEEIEVENDDK